jgi:hypothetical protein
VKVHCNSCNQVTKHRILKSRTHSDSDDDQGISWATTYDMLECLGCDDIMLRSSFFFSENDDTKVTFYPPRVSRKLPDWQYSLPLEIRGVLAEIYTALEADSRRLAMMGARTAIEAAMVSKVGDQGNFSQIVRSFQDEGYVSKTNREYLEIALDAGSASAHRAHVPTVEQLDTVMDILENLLHSVFVLAKPTAKLKAAIPARQPRPNTQTKAAKSQG